MSKGTPAGGRIVTSVRRQTDGAGYCFNDNRANHHGVYEYDVVCCPHCQCTINWQDWRKDREQGGGLKGGYCRQCSAPVCPQCAKRQLKYGCEPFIRRVEQAFEAGIRRRQLSKILGI